MLRAGGTSTALVSNGRRRIHTTFPDESEMVRCAAGTPRRCAAADADALARCVRAAQVEEYDVSTEELLGASAVTRRAEETALTDPRAAQCASGAARRRSDGSRSGRCAPRCRYQRAMLRHAAADARSSAQFLVGEPPRLFNPQTTTLAPSLSNVRLRAPPAAIRSC